MTDVIEVKVEKKPFDVILAGIEYKALPPKALVAVAMSKRLKNLKDDPDSIISELTDFFAGVFGPKTAEAVMARLESPTDDLDLPHVFQLIKLMQEKATGNPTTSPSDS